MSKPGGKALVRVAVQINTWGWEETWDFLPGARGRLGLRRGGVIDLFRRKCQLESTQISPPGLSLKAKLIAFFEKSNSDLCHL